MRIAFFCWEYPPRLVGGLGTYATEITKKFAEYGHYVAVFTQNPDGTLATSEQWIDKIEVHRPVGVDLHSTFPIIVTEDLRRWGTNLKFFCDIWSYNHLSASKFVNEILRKKQEYFDITCVHDWLSSIAGIIIKDELGEKMPVVFHVHSTEEQRSGGRGSEVVRHFERQMAEKASLIITVSYAMRDHLISLGYPAEKINVCWNGCDPGKYDPKKVDSKKVEDLREAYGIQPGERVILFIGRLTWIKGVQNLIMAMPSVLKEFPNVKLTILGKGEAYTDLVSLAKRLEVKERIVFRSEWVPEEERILHYAMAELCVFPSIAEPFGIVSLEAMAMERPVVVGASGLSGFREQVVPDGPDRCGVHVDGRNPSDIAWGIKETLRNPEEAKQWGRNGRKRVLRLFTWNEAARNTLALYETLLRR